ncbi:ribonuclease H-like domain-containing protein [Tanacetum coccineum]
MQPNISLSSEPKDDDPMLDNVTDYQKLIGKLIYLTTTRPDIAYTVSYLSQFMHNPLKSHLKTALKVIMYLKGRPCKEAEYRALVSVTSEVIWVLKILKDLDCNNLFPVKVFCDNNSAIKIAANPILHERTKQLEIDLHFVREKILPGVIKTEKIDTANQIAHILTKGLDIKQHNLLYIMSIMKNWEGLKIPFEKIDVENFKTCIGRCGYGWVYKGVLSVDGKDTTVAVKRLNEQFTQGLKEFLTEIQLLSAQEHPNLISLLGYCDKGKEKIIVYQYAARGSLNRYIRWHNHDE